jgi:hypothetical protein
MSSINYFCLGGREREGNNFNRIAQLTDAINGIQSPSSPKPAEKPTMMHLQSEQP